MVRSFRHAWDFFLEHLWPWMIRVFHALRLNRLISRALVIAVPYGWHILFFLIPFLFIIKISLSEGYVGIPPIKSIVSWGSDQILHLKLDLSSFLFLAEDPLYLQGYLESLTLSFTATLLCLIISYPMAYGIARTTETYRPLLLLLIILPFWTSFLIRVYAWMGLLSPMGLLNTLLMKMGLITEPLKLLYNRYAVCLGIVYSYLPFMILPIYTAIEKIDDRFIEASHDLGARPMQTFLRVTWPLSRRGVIAGALLVFIPGVGEFVIPELLGGSDSLMIGKLLWSAFFFARDWPLASALAMALLALLVIPILMVQRVLAPTERRLS